ncbi:uncharacterized protein BX664DRAFT_387920 [Halteromyces radiatus]|uniref:uncharacterized protein n=1 Tax=Halteromyces radiatus TaxID=101107 RepID=UPI0022200AD7|nr:uncharacterized protein BX664DRAFT_387920 [Halteromyces radiatus]KAI8082774.1 hypothetical protein BX664DRAFT_387920 [Halteromyces radiatus]
MTSLGSLISHADKIPLVGTPLTNMASALLPDIKKSNEKTHSFLTPIPPPPYEKVVGTSKLSQLSDYVWRQGSHFLPDITLSNSVTQSTIDKKQIEQVMTLLHIAAEMDQSGNHQMAKDLYIMGIDRMLSSLPLESDPTLKLALEYRLSDFRNRKQLDLDQPFEETMMAIADCQEIADDDQDFTSLSYVGLKSRLTQIVTSAALFGVDVFKKSPIPDAMAYSLSCALAGLEAMDANYQIRQRTWNMAVQGMAKAIEMDRHYELHRLVMDKLVITCNALLQAAVAHNSESHK